VAAYLDSCVVIYLIEMQEPWHSHVRARLLPAAGVVPEICFSDLTRLECRVGPLMRGDAEALAEYDQFFATPGCRRAVLDAAVFDLATDLRAGHRIGVADALHLAAAIGAGCDEFWTNDLKLEKATAGRVRIVTMDTVP
jgi:predicted nucleic acid-binding protein